MTTVDRETYSATAKQALDTAKDTTSTLEAAYKRTEQTKVVAGEINKELVDQHEKINRANEKAEQVQQELSDGSKLTKYMSMCFCCFLCCDPPEKKKAGAAKQAKSNTSWWGGGQDKAKKKQYEDDRQQLLGSQPPQPQLLQVPQRPPPPSYADQLAQDGHREAGEQIDVEVRKQDNLLGLIYDNVKELGQEAQVTGRIIAAQKDDINRLNNNVYNANETAHKLNQDLHKVRRKQ